MVIMMKKILAFALALSMLVVPAFAADPVRYLPSIPDFLDVSANGVNVRVPIDKTRPEITSFFSDFYDQPYLIVLDQWTATSYYPQFGNSGANQDFIGDDRKWSISFVRPNAEGNFKGYEFTYHDPLTYKEKMPHPMSVSCNPVATFNLSVVTYHYNYQNKLLDSGVLYQNVSRQDFSYVIGSAALSGNATVYPGYSHIGGSSFVVNSYVNGGVAAHYDWWVGRKDIGNDTSSPPSPPDPTDPIPPPIDPPIWPEWDDMQPDSPIVPFDPSVNNDGWQPPKSSGAYDPLPPNYKPENMPGLPDRMPDFTEGGDDPFKPPAFTEGGDDPFEPPAFTEGGDDPFKPPAFTESGDNPFKPPAFTEGGDDPFKPPAFTDGGYNPFKPPAFTEGGDNPFKPPAFTEGGYNPFKLPVMAKSGFWSCALAWFNKK